MTEREAINLLRHALACIWTELEHSDNMDNASGHCQTIAGEALDQTKVWAKPKNLTKLHLHGIEAWEENKRKEA